MSLDITAIEKRIQEIEGAIAQSLANHNALLGALSEAKYVLNMMSELANAVAPDSSFAKVIDAIDEDTE